MLDSENPALSPESFEELKQLMASSSLCDFANEEMYDNPIIYIPKIKTWISVEKYNQPIISSFPHLVFDMHSYMSGILYVHTAVNIYDEYLDQLTKANVMYKYDKKNNQIHILGLDEFVEFANDNGDWLDNLCKINHYINYIEL